MFDPINRGAIAMNMSLTEIYAYLEWIVPITAQRGEYHPWWGPGMMGSWGHGWMGWFGSFMHLLFWGLVIFVLFLLVRRLWSPSQKSSEVMRNESPMDILKRRYASGEIDREEFEQKKQDLSSISP
jgi:putative membrane protein